MPAIISGVIDLNRPGSWFFLILPVIFMAFFSPGCLYAYDAPCYVTQWGSSGTLNSQFVNPTGLALDSAGNVYVAEWDNDRMQKFDGSGNFILKWGS